MSMDPKVKAQWLIDLRSGEYKQTKGKLRAGDTVEYMDLAEGQKVPDGWRVPYVQHTDHVNHFAWRETTVEGVVGHCCLGVLADRLNPDGWIAPDDGCADCEEGESCCEDWRHSWDNGANLLTHEVLDRVGIDSDEQETLAGMNDGGKNFLQIADYIENNL